LLTDNSIIFGSTYAWLDDSQANLGAGEHAAAAQRSSRGVHLIAHGSGHWIQLDQPALVVAAIRQVVEHYRQTRGFRTVAFPPGSTRMQ
jgi:pimeloyl-ACP methyl ester carboxylesterase